MSGFFSKISKTFSGQHEYDEDGEHREDYVELDTEKSGGPNTKSSSDHSSSKTSQTSNQYLKACEKATQSA